MRGLGLGSRFFFFVGPILLSTSPRKCWGSGFEVESLGFGDKPTASPRKTLVIQEAFLSCRDAQAVVDFDLEPLW